MTFFKLFLPILTIVLTVMVVSCDLTESYHYEATRIEHAEEQSDSVVVFEYNNDKIERAVYADRVERFYEKKQTISINVTLEDYYDDGSVMMTLIADSLIVDEVLDIYTALGNVVITRQEGILMTEHLVWNQHRDEIYSPVEATIIRGENLLRGYELTANTDFTRIQLRQVTAEGVIDEEDIIW